MNYHCWNIHLLGFCLCEAVFQAWQACWNACIRSEGGNTC
jgi:hypothetical protein